MEKLEDLPAIIYSAFWLTREMGFLKHILQELNIDKLSILIFLKDYKPGALIKFDGEKGDFFIEPVWDLGAKTLEVDGIFIGTMKGIISLLQGHSLLKGFWYLITRKFKFKGIKALLQILKLLGKVAL
ncbi:MAG: hypothetical protein ACTSUN_04650 [Promethearchaeota archaeon]